MHELRKIFEIIIITEIWLNKNDLKFFNLNKYEEVPNCREGIRGGGILIFIHRNIKFTVVKNIIQDKNHLILLKITDINLNISGFYRSQATEPKLFIELLDDNLE